ncbi:DUF2570 domain-containing protein [Acinetobacter bereziniae]|uniref:DUF2570 domain-containing protein n=1 Tax=Acinetobacter bereziniae TaxID=106648 RepID=UPI0011171858|nr:DUF2570 domain-containing protein [Acinetobacter bereziniae]TNL47749.1 DUF2570 domain-containing protein [Acinetobacter bereziniae]TNL58133.1 DUF2570 domain-containing protein [Acinetobacter bereziniae]
MTYLYLAVKAWREILIGLLAFLLIVCLGLLNSKVSQLNKAQAKYATQIQAIEQEHLKALADKQNNINKVSADYEQLKSEQRVKVETVTREVQKIIERPVYNNVCIDDTGLHYINSLIPDDSS